MFAPLFYHLTFPLSCNANQIDNLNRLIKSRSSRTNPPPHSQSSDVSDFGDYEFSSPVYVGRQDGLKEADKIDALFKGRFLLHSQQNLDSHTSINWLSKLTQMFNSTWSVKSIWNYSYSVNIEA